MVYGPVIAFIASGKNRADRPCDAPESNGRLHEVKDMGDRLYKIGLVLSASNYERHRNIIQAVHRTLAEKGSYALYVITNYGAYYDDMDFRHGEPADYSLLDHIELDGCILEANLGSETLANLIAEKLRKRNIPLIAINLCLPDIPYVNLDLKGQGEQLMKHLLEDHSCERINLVLGQGNSPMSWEMHDVYREMLKKHGIPYQPDRVLESLTSIEIGRQLIDRFADAGVLEDAQAVICVHDVLAIGLCLEAEKRGIRIPEDLHVCSLNYSRNSLIFQPDITGIDRMDQKAAEMACDLLEKLIAGQNIPRVNNYEGTLRYGYSCGHPAEQPFDRERKETLQLQALTKIQMGAQISRMMQFNDSLEKAETPDDWADSMYATLQDLGCRGFYCCLNQSDIPFIASNREDHKTDDSEAYDQTMTVIAGYSRRTEEMRNVSFPLEQLVPVQPEAGDQFLVLPVHHGNRSYGYMVFLNDDLPIEQYTFRIFQESLGNSIDNLHKKMILKSNITELDRLHMEDQMSGLFNRFGLKRFSSVFPEGTAYTVVMIDMDGLKKINDAYGHQAGNNAICMIAEALKETAEPGDLLIRYGGDEFLVLSHNTDPARWEKMKESLNGLLEAGTERQQLPYAVGVSVGYAVSGADGSEKLESVIARADQQMYANKKERAMQQRRN